MTLPHNSVEARKPGSPAIQFSCWGGGVVHLRFENGIVPKPKGDMDGPPARPRQRIDCSSLHSQRFGNFQVQGDLRLPLTFTYHGFPPPPLLVKSLERLPLRDASGGVALRFHR